MIYRTSCIGALYTKLRRDSGSEKSRENEGNQGLILGAYLSRVLQTDRIMHVDSMQFGDKKEKMVIW